MALGGKRLAWRDSGLGGVWLAGMALIAGGLGAAAQARAGSDYSDKEFSVRLPPAFIRFTEVSAVGGATVANRYSSAINPAATDWTHLPQKFTIAPYYSAIMFREGTNLHLTGESLTWQTGHWGTFQPTLSQVRSNTARTKLSLTFDYSVDTAQVQWGKRWGTWGVGATFNVAKAKIVQKGTVPQFVPGVGLVPTYVRTEGNAESYRFRAGTLFEPCKNWLVGAIFEYGFQPFRSETRLTMPAGQAGLVTTTRKDGGTQHQFLLRPGVAWHIDELSSVWMDYAMGMYCGESDRLWDHCFSAGIDRRVLPWLVLRGSLSLDTRGNAGGGVGASVFLGRQCSLEVGYQYNMLPELQPELGRAHTLQCALSVRF